MGTSVEKLATAEASKRSLLSRQGWMRIGVLAVLAGAFFSYAPALQFGFVYDDFSQVVNNPRIRSARLVPEYFTKDVWAHQQGRPQNLYRPLFLVWLLANFKSFALQARYWHLAAILMHMLVVLLVYFLARSLLPEKPLAALVAASFFAVHPSHVEAIAWISGATEPLLGALFVGSFLCYLRSREQKPGRLTWRAASILLGAGAMLAKETGVMLPAVIICYEWLADSDRPAAGGLHRRWLTVAGLASPYIALVEAYFLMRVIALHAVAHSFSDVPVWKSILTWPWVVYFYLSQLLFPMGLGPYYDVNYASGFNTVVPLLVVVGVAAAMWWWRRKSESRLPAFLASWFFLTLAPVLALFLVVWRYDNVHDRYLYLPSVALVILVGHVIATVAEKLLLFRKKWLWMGATAVLVLLAIATHRQTFWWENNLALYARGVAVAPHNLMARLNLASALFENHQYEDAFRVAQEALQIDPNSPLALTDVAEAAYFHGDYPAAERYYSRTLSLASPSVDQIYYLASARIKMGRYQEALFVLQQGIHRWPNAPGYHALMGQAFAAMGEWAAAREQYKLELKLDPANSEAQGRLAEAEEHLR
jgi:tetratricopeptide (TPR) repeat protein